MREAVFGILGDRVDGASVLDLFAGTGAMALEALSRGARTALFVDRSSHSVRTVRLNLDALQLGAKSHVVRDDAVAVVRRLARAGERFHLVLADPPYESGEAERLVRELGAAGILAPGGVLVVEFSRRHTLPTPEGLTPVDERHYGDTAVVRFEVIRRITERLIL